MVPSDYFDTLQKKIGQRVRLLEDMEKSFGLPAHYFEDFQRRLKYRIQVEEQEEEKALQLPGLMREDTGFSVPNGYFENLSMSVTEIVQEESHLQVVAKTEKKIRTSKIRRLNWISYAAAACVIFVLGTTFLFRLSSSNQTFQRQLDSIPDTEIINYLEYYSEPEDALSTDAQLEEIMEISGKPPFSNEDIQAYLDYSI